MLVRLTNYIFVKFSYWIFKSCMFPNKCVCTEIVFQELNISIKNLDKTNKLRTILITIILEYDLRIEGFLILCYSELARHRLSLGGGGRSNQ